MFRLVEEAIGTSAAHALEQAATEIMRGFSSFATALMTEPLMCSDEQDPPAPLTPSPTPDPIAQIITHASTGDIAQFYNCMTSIEMSDVDKISYTDQLLQNIGDLTKESIQHLHMIKSAISSRREISEISTTTISNINSKISEAIKLLDSEAIEFLKADALFVEQFKADITAREAQIDENHLNALLPDPLGEQFVLVVADTMGDSPTHL